MTWFWQPIPAAAVDVSPGGVALAGQGSSATPGFLSSALSRAVSGSVQTTAQGTVTPQLVTLVQLTGEASSMAQGALAKTLAAALATQAQTAAHGTLTATNNIALNAQSISTSAGLLAVSFSVNLTGRSYAPTTGSLTALALNPYPLPSQVLEGVVYGAAFELTGTLRTGGGGFYRRR